MSKQELLQRLSDFQNTREPRIEEIPGVLGLDDAGKTVRLANRPNYHWVRLYDGSTEQPPVAALNTVTSATHGLAVIVVKTRRGNHGRMTWVVKGSNLSTEGATIIPPFLKEHHESHEWSSLGLGSDPVNIFPRAFAFGRVYQTSPASMVCNVSPIKYSHLTALQVYPGGQTQNFTTSIPAAANTAVLVLVSLNGATNTLAYEVGTAFSWTGWTDPVPPFAVPTAQLGQLVLSCVLLYNGMTSITEQNFRYEFRLPWQTLGGGGAIQFGTNAERLAITDKTPYAGMFWFETDTESMYMSDGTYWYSAGSWTVQPDQALATEDGQFISTEDGQGIGIEVEQ